MNIENLKRLRAKLVELDDSQLDMENYVSNCGTVRCVAGWVTAWFGKPSSDGYLTNFRNFLELGDSYKVYIWLCHSSWKEKYNTVEHVIERLDYLIEHEDVPPNFIGNITQWFEGEITL